MRTPAAFLLLLLLAVFHAPLAAAASGASMDCCAGGMTQMCCPLPGSTSMRSCRGDEREATLSAMGAFLLPGRVPAARPAFSSLPPPADSPSLAFEALPVLDPPPRV
jgi:hypothetical protein